MKEKYENYKIGETVFMVKPVFKTNNKQALLHILANMIIKDTKKLKEMVSMG